MAVDINQSVLSSDELRHLKQMQSTSWGYVLLVAFIVGINAAVIFVMIFCTDHGPGASRTPFNMCMIAGAIVGLGVGYYFNKPRPDKEIESYLRSIGYYSRVSSSSTNVYSSTDIYSSHSKTVRSDWEKDIAAWLKHNYPSLRLIENDRTTITSDSGAPLELDFLFPDINLAIEANGERWHNHSGYNQDKSEGTQHSEEMYKLMQCANKGIRLIHVWDSQSDSEIHRTIDEAISRAKLYQ